MLVLNSYISQLILYEYPSAAMTAQDTIISGQPYGNGSQRAFGSSTLAGNNNWVAMDKSAAVVWISVASKYNTTTGAYIGATTITATNTITYSGEYYIWYPAATAVRLRLYSYSITAETTNPARTPYSWVVVASLTNGAGTYDLIDTQSNVTFSAGETKIFTVNSSVGYYSFRIYILNVAPSNDGFTSMAEWKLFSLDVF